MALVRVSFAQPGQGANQSANQGEESMYTGIVQACCPIDRAERQPGLLTFGITLPPEISAEVTLGASIAINGCCFTVTSMAHG